MHFSTGLSHFHSYSFFQSHSLSSKVGSCFFSLGNAVLGLLRYHASVVVGTMVLMSAVMSFLCALSWQPAVFCPLLVKAKFRFVMRFKFVRDEPNLWEISSLTKFRFGHFLFGSACIESIVCRQIGCRSPWASCCFEVIWILKPLRAAESLFCIHFFSTSKEPATASGGAGAAPENKVHARSCKLFYIFELIGRH